MNYKEFKNIISPKKELPVCRIKSVKEYNDAKEQLSVFERNYEASKEDWEQLKAVFDEIIKNLTFDADKINDTAKTLNWKYFNTPDRTITIDDVINTATMLFEDICERCNGTGMSSTGGVTVKINLITKQVNVNFCLSENYAFWDETTNSVEY